MDIKTFDHLSTLSKLTFNDDEKNRFMHEMEDIIGLMDTIKDFDITYDDTKDFNEISFDDLREDKAKPSFSPDELLSNTEPRDNCYVIPRLME